MKENKYTPYDGQALATLVQNHSYTVDGSQFNTIVQAPKKELVEDIAPYFPSKELIDAIEYARILQRPLLLRGEPGCGKTRVAQALAYELYHQQKGDNYRNHYFEWFIKSSTKAKEGLYQYDHLGRLRDIQTFNKQEPIAYRSFGPLGKAFLASKPDAPAVLLIDEIDKADLDFPNDLLLELDEKRFYIEETQEEIRAEYSPIVIITSNDEKELPNAFLRRCVFHYIEFPKLEELYQIAKARVLSQEQEMKKAMPDTLVEKLVDQFYELHQSMKASPNTDKRVSTSELLDWLRLVHYYYLTDKLPLEKDQLPTNGLLYPEVLLKSLDDYKQYAKKK